MIKSISSIGLLLIAAQVQAIEVGSAINGVHAPAPEASIISMQSETADKPIQLAGNCRGLNQMYTYEEAMSLGIQCN